LSLQKSDTLAAKAYARQPQLLSSVLALSWLGVGHDAIGRLLKILLVCLEAVEVADRPLPALRE